MNGYFGDIEDDDTFDADDDTLDERRIDEWRLLAALVAAIAEDTERLRAAAALIHLTGGTVR